MLSNSSPSPPSYPHVPLTFCSIPRGFQGHIGTIQRNAIRSWSRLSCKPEILLFGRDPGVPEMAAEVGARVLPIRCNEYGTPLLDDLFEQVRTVARHPNVCYVNTDIILFEDFLRALQVITRRWKQFLMVGQRWNLDLTTEIEFTEGWEHRLRADAQRRGELFGPQGVDYFVFSRESDFQFPPFAVGRANWDNWFLYRARRLRLPMIDATADVLAIHQNHDYKHVPRPPGESNELPTWHVSSRTPEGQANFRLTGGEDYLFGLADATHRLVNGTPQRILSRESLKLLRLRLPVLYPALMPLILVVRSFLRGLRKLGLKV